MTFLHYKQSHPPTVVEHCIQARLVSVDEVNLVVAKATVLEIYKLRNKSSGGDLRERERKGQHLVLVGRFPIHGVIVALAKVTLVQGRADQLLVATKDAKVALVAFDQCLHRLVNVSLHWFEDDAIKNGMMTNPSDTLIRVDPNSRCAVVFEFGRCLTIIPFNKKEDIGFADDIPQLPDNQRRESALMLHHTRSHHGSYPTTKSHSLGYDGIALGDDVGTLRRIVRPSYTRPISDFDNRIRTVHDMSFLHGYFEPTLVILFETNDTWEGNLITRSDTVGIIAISLNVIDHQHHVIWHVSDLPYDLRRIQLVPEPLGGLVLIGTNSMVYLNQSSPAYGVSVNSNADGRTNFPLVPQPDIAISLNDSVSVFLDETKMFLSTSNGSIYSVALKIDGRNVKGFAIHKVGASVMPACICVVQPGVLFLGSRLGDSLLMTYEDNVAKHTTAETVQLANALALASGVGSVDTEKMGTSDFRTKRLAEGDLDDDLFIYEVAEKNDAHSTEDSVLSFKVCDLLMNVGPITDFCLGEPAYVSDEYVREDRYDLELVTCTGHGKNGALCLLQRGIRPQVLTTFPLETRNGMWAVYDACDEEEGEVRAQTSGVDNSRANDDGKDGDGKRDFQNDEYHAYLFLTTNDSTMVLRTDEELAEVDAGVSGFKANVKTLLVGNLGNRKFIVQVHPHGLLVLHGMTEIQELKPATLLNMDAESTGVPVIIKAEVADPYLCLLFNTGDVLLFEFDETKRVLVHKHIKSMDKQSPVSAIALYHDKDLILFPKDEYVGQSPVPSCSSHNSDIGGGVGGTKRTATDMYSDDEDEDDALYGDDYQDENNSVVPDSITKTSAASLPSKKNARVMSVTANEALGLGVIVDEGEDVNPPVVSYLFIASASGGLSVYDIARNVECFRVEEFSNGPEMLADAYTGMEMEDAHDFHVGQRSSGIDSKQDIERTGSNANANGIGEKPPSAGGYRSTGTKPIVVELSMQALGTRREFLHLFAITSNGDLNVYKAFHCQPTPNASVPLVQRGKAGEHVGDDRNALLRFRKVEHDIILRPMDNVEDEWAFGPGPTTEDDKNDEEDEGDDEGNTIPGADVVMVLTKPKQEKWLTSVSKHVQQIFPFSNISTYNGVVITGKDTRPWWLVATRKGLRTHPMYVDTGAIFFSPFHNVNCTHGFMYFNNEHELRICQLPQHLLYDSAWPSRKVPLRATPHHITYHVESKQYVVAKSVDEEVLEVARTTNDTKDQPPQKFEGGPRYVYPREPKFSVSLISPLTWEEIDSFELPLYEHITCMESVTLRSEETASGMKPFIAVSTLTVMGEETTPKGKVYLFEVIEVVPEPGRPQTNHKLKKVYDKVQKGPVTALNAINGLLITAQGQKIYIWMYQNRMLVGKAFIDAQLYTVKLSVARSFVLVADIFNSISLLRYQEEEKTFSLISRDYNKIPLFTSAYVVDDTTLASMATDMDGNLMVFGYVPDDPESLGGNKLMRKADMHIGGLVSAVTRVEARPPPGSRYPKRRHVNVMAALDGSISLIQPIDEKIYRRLSMVQTRLTSQLNHNLGQNPKAFRLIKQESTKLANASKNVLDGDLLARFPSLSLSMRKELAKQIGSDHVQITQSLQEVDHATSIL